MKLFHYLYAKARRRYWGQCPICGRSFGGHQKRGTLWFDETFTSGRFTCPRCPGDWVRDHEGNIKHMSMVEWARRNRDAD
jgi:hypothetical protein